MVFSTTEYRTVHTRFFCTAARSASRYYYYLRFVINPQIAAHVSYVPFVYIFIRSFENVRFCTAPDPSSCSRYVYLAYTIWIIFFFDLFIYPSKIFERSCPPPSQVWDPVARRNRNSLYKTLFFSYTTARCDFSTEIGSCYKRIFFFSEPSPSSRRRGGARKTRVKLYTTVIILAERVHTRRIRTRRSRKPRTVK